MQWVMMKLCIRAIVLYNQHTDLLRVDRIYDNTLCFVDAQWKTLLKYSLMQDGHPIEIIS